MDKGLKRYLKELGLHPGQANFQLDQDDARDLGADLNCRHR